MRRAAAPLVVSVGTLGTSAFEINGATLNYQLRDAIKPALEPATWMMVLLGIAMTGAAMRRRRARACPGMAHV